MYLDYTILYRRLCCFSKEILFYGIYSFIWFRWNRLKSPPISHFTKAADRDIIIQEGKGVKT